MIEEVKKWMEKAKSDLKHAKFSLRNKDFDWAQVASQQAAEKALKAVCLYKGVGLIKVHDLTILARRVNAPNDILENCGLLNPFYTASRYPDVEEDTNKMLEEAAAKDAIESSGESCKMVQGTNKNIRLVRKFKRDINKSIKVDQIILYGSRAKGNFHKYSDFDLLIISPDFKGIPWYKRPAKFYLMWKEDYPLEILCYTPEEIRKRMEKINIVSEAFKEGIEI